MESKHISAVKKPWHSSSKNNPLEQILKTNVRNSKISAACTDFSHWGMLHGDVLLSAHIDVGIHVAEDFPPPEIFVESEDLEDVDVVDGIL